MYWEMHKCKLSLDGSVVMMMMVLFVVLHPLHPVCQPLQLLSEAGQLPLLVPLPLLSLPPAVLHCDGLVWLYLDIILVTKQHLKN